MYSASINNLVASLKKLPSVGQRTAERFVFHWLKSGRLEVNQLREALDNLLKNTKSCEICWNFDDTNPCRICADSRRDHGHICVVADPQNIPAMERTGAFRGTYHVLRGLIEAGDEDSLKYSKIRELLLRVKNDKTLNIITEIILALNPDLPGETTILFLKREIAKINPKIKISRLARGLPMGSDLQYADEITLTSALKNRV